MAINPFNISFCISLNPTSRHPLIFSVSTKTGSLTPRRVKSVRSYLARNPNKESKKGIQDLLAYNRSSDYYHCPVCCRRHFIGAVLGTGLLPISSSSASDKDSTFQDSMAKLNRIHPPRPDWYEEFYASAMDKSMISYEAEIAGFKSQIFSSLRGVDVFGIDPNKKMERYAQTSAEAAGIPPSKFRFMQAVAEALPLNDASVDAVVGTLVLCSVKDVDLTLQEVRRVLKPGGYYVFVEHVAAKDGTILRFVQGILDPLQQIVADGCHLTRNTGTDIARRSLNNLGECREIREHYRSVNLLKVEESFPWTTLFVKTVRPSKLREIVLKRHCTPLLGNTLLSLDRLLKDNTGQEFPGKVTKSGPLSSQQLVGLVEQVATCSSKTQVAQV